MAPNRRRLVSGTRMPRLLAGLLGALLLGVLSLSASGPAQAAGSSGATPPGKAWVRVGHFVPTMGAVSIKIAPISGGQAMMLADSESYGQVSDYRRVDPGDYTVTVRMSTSSDSAPMLSRSLEVEADQARTIAVLGTAAAPRLAVLSDDLTTPSAGTARVRVLSATDQAGPVTVAAVDGPTIADAAVEGQATGYATVPAGTWTLQLTGAASGAARTSLQNVSIRSGSVYTVVVLDAARQVKLDVVSDAAGAVQAPRGGAHTGLGGMAPHPSGTGSVRAEEVALVVFASACLLSALGAGRLRALRRRRRVAR